jgi:hypothetical protein
MPRQLNKFVGKKNRYLMWHYLRSTSVCVNERCYSGLITALMIVLKQLEACQHPSVVPSETSVIYMPLVLCVRSVSDCPLRILLILYEVSKLSNIYGDRDVPCSLVKGDGRFSGTYCLQQRPDDGGSKYLRSIYQTTVWNSPEDNHLHICCCENQNSRQFSWKS